MLTRVGMSGCHLLMKTEKNILQGSLPLAFIPQVFLLLSAQQVLKWSCRTGGVKLRRWPSVLSGLPKYLKCLLLGTGIGSHSFWGDASVLAFLYLYLLLFPQAIKSKADNRPDLNGTLQRQPGLSGSTDSIKTCSVKEG